VSDWGERSELVASTILAVFFDRHPGSGSAYIKARTYKRCNITYMRIYIKVTAALAAVGATVGVAVAAVVVVVVVGGCSSSSEVT